MIYDDTMGLRRAECILLTGPPPSLYGPMDLRQGASNALISVRFRIGRRKATYSNGRENIFKTYKVRVQIPPWPRLNRRIGLSAGFKPLDESRLGSNPSWGTEYV